MHFRKIKAMQLQKIVFEVEISSDASEFAQYEHLKTAIDLALNQTLQMPNAGFQPVRSAKVVKIMPQRAKRTHRDVQLPDLNRLSKQLYDPG